MDYIVLVLLLAGPAGGALTREGFFDAVPADRSPAQRRVVQAEVVIAAVACGDHLQEALTMLKSCVMFAQKSPLKFIIFTEDSMIKRFQHELTEWQRYGKALTFDVRNLSFPRRDADQWRALCKPCSSQRLFLPSLLPDVDALIYLDTDVLFLSPVKDLWDYFLDFNSTHMVAMAEDLGYDDNAKVPFYGRSGLNAGVMLMNLTRLRAFGWERQVSRAYYRWRAQLQWGDQDLINVIVREHPGCLLLLGCDLNYRANFCSGPACEAAERGGARLLHALGGDFSGRQPAFSALYRAVQAHRLQADPRDDFLPPLATYQAGANLSNCKKNFHVFTTIPRQTFKGW